VVEYLTIIKKRGKIMSTFVIEEPNIDQYEVFLEYYKSIDSKNYEHYSIENFKNYINKYISNSIYNPSKFNNNFMAFQKIYFLIEKETNKIIGKLSVLGLYDENGNIAPEILYEIRADERKKGNGLRLLKLFLENNNLDVEYFCVSIYPSNIPSLKIIRKFNPELVQTSLINEKQMQHFHVKNLSRIKKE
jgi:predicted acetyltransferase